MEFLVRYQNNDISLGHQIINNFQIIRKTVKSLVPAVSEAWGGLEGRGSVSVAQHGVQAAGKVVGQAAGVVVFRGGHE